MSRISGERRYLGRLEDFIEIAQAGKRVEVEIELRKQPITQASRVSEKQEKGNEFNSYLMIAEFTFKIDGQIRKMSKVYMFATTGESLNSSRVNKNITNARLQADYRRLKGAHVYFHEKYF